MSFRVTSGVLLLAVAAAPAEGAGRLGLFGRGSSQARQQQQQPEKPKGQFEEFKPPGAPRVERPQRRYRPGAYNADPRTTIQLVDSAIERSKKRPLVVGRNTPWQILHGALALRGDLQLRVGRETVPALDWLSAGVVHDGLPLIQKTEHGGRCHPFSQPYAFEGHTNQFLAILSVCGLTAEHEFKTPQGETVTMGDMVNEAQMSIDGKGEMTWTLWFLTHYLEPDAEWENAAGQYWSMERLVQMETRHSVEEAPCGGTHRLFALALARNSYLAKHGRLAGTWVEADQKVRKYEQAARSLQNRDGSLSSEWFKGRGYSNELERRLKTSGHVLEWLMVSVSEKDLKSAWVQRAVQSVANDVLYSLGTEVECGAYYHALDALRFYQMRVRPEPQSEPTAEPEQLVQTEPEKTADTAAEETPLDEPEIDVPDAPIVADLPPEQTPAEPAEEMQPPVITPRPAVEEPEAAVVLVDPEEAGEDAPPMMTKLPEGIDDEASPIAAAERAAEAKTLKPNGGLEVEDLDLPNRPAGPAVAETPVETEPETTEPKPAADEPKPEKPLQTAEAPELPKLRQLSGDLIVEDIPPSELNLAPVRETAPTPLPVGASTAKSIAPATPPVEDRPIVVEHADEFAMPVRTP